MGSAARRWLSGIAGLVLLLAVLPWPTFAQQQPQQQLQPPHNNNDEINQQLEPSAALPNCLIRCSLAGNAQVNIDRIAKDMTNQIVSELQSGQLTQQQIHSPYWFEHRVTEQLDRQQQQQVVEPRNVQKFYTLLGNTEEEQRFERHRQEIELQNQLYRRLFQQPRFEQFIAQQQQQQQQQQQSSSQYQQQSQNTIYTRHQPVLIHQQQPQQQTREHTVRVEEHHSQNVQPQPQPLIIHYPQQQQRTSNIREERREQTEIYRQQQPRPIVIRPQVATSETHNESRRTEAHEEHRTVQRPVAVVQPVPGQVSTQSQQRTENSQTIESQRSAPAIVTVHHLPGPVTQQRTESHQRQVIESQRRSQPAPAVVYVQSRPQTTTVVRNTTTTTVHRRRPHPQRVRIHQPQPVRSEQRHSIYQHIVESADRQVPEYQPQWRVDQTAETLRLLEQHHHQHQQQQPQVQIRPTQTTTTTEIREQHRQRQQQPQVVHIQPGQTTTTTEIREQHQHRQQQRQQQPHVVHIQPGQTTTTTEIREQHQQRQQQRQQQPQVVHIQPSQTTTTTTEIREQHQQRQQQQRQQQPQVVQFQPVQTTHTTETRENSLRIEDLRGDLQYYHIQPFSAQQLNSSVRTGHFWNGVQLYVYNATIGHFLPAATGNQQQQQQTDDTSSTITSSHSRTLLPLPGVRRDEHLSQTEHWKRTQQLVTELRAHGYQSAVSDQMIDEIVRRGGYVHNGVKYIFQDTYYVAQPAVTQAESVESSSETRQQQQLNALHVQLQTIGFADFGDFERNQTLQTGVFIRNATRYTWDNQTQTYVGEVLSEHDIQRIYERLQQLLRHYGYRLTTHSETAAMLHDGGFCRGGWRWVYEVRSGALHQTERTASQTEELSADEYRAIYERIQETLRRLGYTEMTDAQCNVTVVTGAFERGGIVYRLDTEEQVFRHDRLDAAAFEARVQVLRELLRAIGHRELDEHQLQAIVYRGHFIHANHRYEYNPASRFYEQLDVSHEEYERLLQQLQQQLHAIGYEHMTLVECNQTIYLGEFEFNGYDWVYNYGTEVYDRSDERLVTPAPLPQPPQTPLVEVPQETVYSRVTEETPLELPATTETLPSSTGRPILSSNRGDQPPQTFVDDYPEVVAPVEPLPQPVEQEPGVGYYPVTATTEVYVQRAAVESTTEQVAYLAPPHVTRSQAPAESQVREEEADEQNNQDNGQDEEAGGEEEEGDEYEEGEEEDVADNEE